MAQEFRIVVKIDPRQAKAGGRQVEATLNRTQKAADQLRSTLVRAFTFTAAVLAVRRITRTVANFEQELATVRAITGATEDQFADLRAEAQRLGATTRFTATQAGEGLQFLARAGFTVDESLRAVEGTLKLAQAGNLDLGRAADIATNVLKAFRQEVNQTSRVVDVLAKTANSSNTNVEQLGDAIKLVGPIAAGVGVDLEEAASAIGALSNAGLQATLAGTGLRRVLAELEAPTDASIAELRRLGITADEVRVSEVGLTDALKRLRDAGIDTGTALQIFGQRGGPAFEVLVNSIPDIERLNQVLDDAGGTADEVARIMDDNLNGALLAVRSSVEALILALGDTGATDAATQSLFGLAGAFRFLARNAEALSIVLSAVAAVLVVRFTPAVIALLAKLKLLNLALLTNPFTVLVVGAASAGVALKALGSRLDEIEKRLKEAEAGVKSQLTEYGKLGDEALRLEERIRIAQQGLEDFGDPTGARLNQLALLINRLREVREQMQLLKDNTDSAKEARERQNEAIRKVAVEYAKVITQLKDEARLLQVSNQEREIQSQLLELENKLREDNVGLTEAQRAAILAQLRQNQALSDLTAILDELRGPAEEFQRTQEALILGLATGTLTVDEYALALERLNEAQARAGTGFQDGINRAVYDFGANMRTTADIVEQVFGAALNRTADLLANFVTTGKADFKEFARALIADIARIIARLLILQAIQAITGTGGGGGGGPAPAAVSTFSTFVQPSGGRQHGGAVDSTRSFLVGERGPEIFRPPGQGTIIPARETERIVAGQRGPAAAAPVVNVQNEPPPIRIVNQIDSREVVQSGFETPEGEELFVNMVQKTRDRLRRILA